MGANTITRIILPMSPTVFREGGLRFYFFSREEPRMIAEALRLVQEHANDIRSAWHKHFPR